MFGFGKFFKKSTAKTVGTGLSYCENVFASGTSPKHIRQLTENGLKQGGGADTLALCEMKVAWDVSEIESLAALEQRKSVEHASNRICSSCLTHARELLS